MELDKRNKMLNSTINILEKSIKDGSYYESVTFIELWWVLALTKLDRMELFPIWQERALDFVKNVRENPKLSECKRYSQITYYLMYVAFNVNGMSTSEFKEKINAFIDYYKNFCETQYPLVKGNLVPYEELVLWFIIAGKESNVVELLESNSMAKVSALMRDLYLWIKTDHSVEYATNIRKILNKRRSSLNPIPTTAFIYYYVYHFVIMKSSDVLLIVKDIYE